MSSMYKYHKLSPSNQHYTLTDSNNTTTLQSQAKMKLSLLSLLPMALGSVIFHPRQSNDRGNYTVPGLGERKAAVLAAGGNTMDMAIAMLETYAAVP